MQLSRWRAALILGMSLVSVAAWADGLAQLKIFNEEAHDLSGNFKQTVTNNKGIKKSAGVFSISRPRFFRWEYQTPYKQLIIGDGKTIWLYDEDLAQVVKKQQSASLGESPAAILADRKALDHAYTLRNHGQKNGIEYVLATPKSSDAGYQYIEIGLKGNLPVTMRLKDSFGSQSVIEFVNLSTAPVSKKQYQFTPPKNVDVLAD